MKKLFFVVAIIFTSFVLRGPIASVGSIVDLIGEELSLSKGELGFITTLPLLTFAVCSIMIPRISSKLGHLNTMTAGIVILGIGCALRIIDGYVVILLGTLLLGIGISAGNVLLPAIIKENAPTRIGIYTSTYLCGQNVAAFAGAAFSYPIAVSLTWRGSLTFWIFPACVAFVFWLLYMWRRRGAKEKLDAEAVSGGDARSKPEADSGGDIIVDKSDREGTRLTTSRLAWYITIIMGLQSVVYYSITAWLPVILQASISAEAAGYMASLFQLLALPAIFVTPMLVANTKNKAIMVVLAGLFYTSGVLLLFFIDNTIILILAIVLLSCGGGASFSWVVTMIAVITDGPEEASRLSGMSQSLGYVMAAIGPTLSGVIVDATGSWSAVLILLSVISALIAVFGYLTHGKTHL